MSVCLQRKAFLDETVRNIPNTRLVQLIWNANTHPIYTLFTWLAFIVVLIGANICVCGARERDRENERAGKRERWTSICQGRAEDRSAILHHGINNHYQPLAYPVCRHWGLSWDKGPCEEEVGWWAGGSKPEWKNGRGQRGINKDSSQPSTNFHITCNKYLSIHLSLYRLLPEPTKLIGYP